MKVKFASGVQQLCQIFFRRGDLANIIVLYQNIQYIPGQKCRQCRSKQNIMDPQMQQRQKDTDCLLFIPGKHHRERQFIDTAAKCLCQRKCDPDRTIGIIALPDIHNTRKPCYRPKIQVIETELSTSQRQYDRIRRCLFDKFRIVVSARLCTVTATHQKEMTDLSCFDRFHHFRRMREH